MARAFVSKACSGEVWHFSQRKMGMHYCCGHLILQFISTCRSCYLYCPGCSFELTVMCAWASRGEIHRACLWCIRTHEGEKYKRTARLWSASEHTKGRNTNAQPVCGLHQNTGRGEIQTHSPSVVCIRTQEGEKYKRTEPVCGLHQNTQRGEIQAHRGRLWSASEHTKGRNTNAQPVFGQRWFRNQIFSACFVVPRQAGSFYTFFSCSFVCYFLNYCSMSYINFCTHR